MTIRFNFETIVLVGVVIAAFVMALVCLACSLNSRELLDCSLFRCCRRRRNRPEDDEPQTYSTLNEFIFESEDEERAGFVAMNNMPTTMEQVFPDLLGGGDEEMNNNSKNNTTNNNPSNTGLGEPLL